MYFGMVVHVGETSPVIIHDDSSHSLIYTSHHCHFNVNIKILCLVSLFYAKKSHLPFTPNPYALKRLIEALINSISILYEQIKIKINLKCIEYLDQG